MTRHFTTVIALAIASLGGFAFSVIGVPLPWTLGALTASAVVVQFREDLVLPGAFYKIARPVVGVLAGSSFTTTILLLMIGWLEILPILICFFVVTTFLGYYYFQNVVGFDKSTAFFSSTPGGLSELSLLGQDHGANGKTLVTIHTIRVMSVAAICPFVVRYLEGPTTKVTLIGVTTGINVPEALDWLILLLCGGIGYLLARRWPIPSASLLFPLILSIIVHVAGLTDAELPVWVSPVAQIVIGSICGSRLKGMKWHDARRTIVHGLLWTAALIVLALIAAEFSSQFVGVRFTSVVLAFAPGGFAEVTVIAIGAGLDVSFVVACQVFRSLFVMSWAPLQFALQNGKS